MKINKQFFCFTLFAAIVIIVLFAQCVDSKQNKSHLIKNGKSIGDAVIQHYPPLTDYHQYQTFDEFSMKGVGRVIKCPFVYVHKSDNLILVTTSLDTLNVKSYYKKNNVWLSLDSFDLDKRFFALTKSGHENPARTYIRLFLPDTIIELRTIYIQDFRKREVYIKTRERAFWVATTPQDFQDEDNPDNDMITFCRRFFNDRERFMAEKWGTGKYNKRSMREYIFKENNENYSYISVDRKEHLIFKKTPLALFAIQPGFDFCDIGKSTFCYY